MLDRRLDPLMPGKGGPKPGLMVEPLRGIPAAEEWSTLFLFLPLGLLENNDITSLSRGSPSAVEGVHPQVKGCKGYNIYIGNFTTFFYLVFFFPELGEIKLARGFGVPNPGEPRLPLLLILGPS